MINLTFETAYQYTKRERRHLKSLRRKYGRYYQSGYGKSNRKVWYDGEKRTKEIKHEISKRLLTQARFRCAYCAKLLTGGEKAIDHFIPNAEHPVYSFHPLNLVPSCGYCNETLKGSLDTLAIRHKKYHRIVFKIVHPIIHDVATHLFYIAPENLILDIPRCTVLAKESIKVFKLDSFEMTMLRTQQEMIEANYPLSDEDLQKLVAETATYRP